MLCEALAGEKGTSNIKHTESDVFKETKARALGAKETGATPSKALQATERNMNFLLITMEKTNVGKEVTGSYLQ